MNVNVEFNPTFPSLLPEKDPTVTYNGCECTLSELLEEIDPSGESAPFDMPIKGMYMGGEYESDEETYTLYWFLYDVSTVITYMAEMQKNPNADKFLVILDSDGTIIYGKQVIAAAIMLGFDHVRAVRLDFLPPCIAADADGEWDSEE